MAHATYPFVFSDENEAEGAWTCQMRDKKTGSIWGTGFGDTRQAAIYSARRDQPRERTIRKAIGWVNRHPFLVGAALGVYLASRSGIRGHRPSLADYAVTAVISGTISWAISKAIGFIGRLITGRG